MRIVLLILLAATPALAFDPFDTVGRQAWLRTADRKRKEEVLARLQKRLVVNKDMPPEDAAEHKLFRQSDPYAFDEVKAFLEAELNRANGK